MLSDILYGRAIKQWGKLEEEFVHGPGGRAVFRQRRIRKWGSYVIPSPTELTLTTVNISIPKTVHELCNPAYWIADTGASVHSTGYPEFIHNCRKVTGKDAITAAQGATMLPSKVGEMICAVMNKEGGLQFQLFPTVNEIHVMPQGFFNLWSITKSLTEGWQMNDEW